MKQRKTIPHTHWRMLAVCILLIAGVLTGLGIFMPTARAAGEAYYQIAVQVTDLSPSGYSSCANSAGYIVIPTRKQDGTAGETWYSGVPSKDWDTENMTKFYLRYEYKGRSVSRTEALNAAGSTGSVDGFPTEIRLVQTYSPTDTNYIKSNNATYKSQIRFTIWIRRGGGSWFELQSWEETTWAGGSWSDSKTVNVTKYPVPAAAGNVTGPATVEIPKSGTAGYNYTAEIYDQYGSRWYQDNANTVFSISGAPEGMSISSTGRLTVNAAAADNVSTPGDFSTTVTAAVGATSKSMTVDVTFPRYTVSYYNEGELIASSSALYRSTWSHTADTPAKEPDSAGHYTFAGWMGNGGSMQITGDTDFIARYDREAHSMKPDIDCKEKTCSVCGYKTEATLSDALEGSGTQESPWLIRDDDDMETVHRHIIAHGDISGKYFRLENDLDTSYTLGSSLFATPFTGHFDGNGHTIHYSIYGDNQYNAPFMYIRNATIRNLKVTGYCTGNRHSAGLVGKAKGTNLIENCDVAMEIHCNNNVYCGGILGHGLDSDTTIRGCVFRGSICEAIHAGTIWGWSDEGANPVIEDCLDISSSTHPIALGEPTTGEGLANTYYTNADKTEGTSRVWAKRGSHAVTVTMAEGVNADPGIRKTYSVSGITACESGIRYNGAFYLGEGEKMLLKPGSGADLPEDRMMAYTASSGTLTPGQGGYTLTAGSSDCEIGMTEITPFAGEGTAESPWQIGSSGQWDTLAAAIGMGFDTSGKVFRMTGNIAVTEMLGTPEHPFKGIFDGAGHTLNVTLSSDETAAAPFSRCSGATIRNLKVSGTVNGGMHCAGLAGSISGCTISHVEVATAITTSGTHCGGIVGHGGSAAATLDGCVFSGSISGATTAGTIWGWSDNASPVIENCLDSSESTHPIGRGGGSIDVSNTYYTQADKKTGGSQYWSGSLRGIRARTIICNPLMTVTMTGTAGVCWNGIIFAGAGETVSFTAVNAAGEAIHTLTAAYPGEDETELTADADGVFHVTMPEGGMALNVQLVTVTYLDTDGSVLMTESRRIGENRETYRPADRQGQRFRGWLKAGELLTESSQAFNEDTSLTASWTAVSWHSITAGAGIRATDGNGNETAWGNTGDTVRVQIAEDELSMTEDQYCDGWQINGTAGEGNSFDMPDEDVTLAPLIAESTIIELNLTGKAPVRAENIDTDEFAQIMQAKGYLLSSAQEQMSLDLNGDGNADVTAVTDGDGTAVVFTREDGAGSITQPYKAALAGLRQSYIFRLVRTFDNMLEGSGTGNDPWLIQSAEDWDTLAELTAHGEETAERCFRLTEDISVRTMIGTTEHPFRGVFIGGGHTLNADLESTERYCAPFSQIRNASITEVKVTGTVFGNMHCAGLAGGAFGSGEEYNYIGDCEVNARIISAGTHCGGILGHGHSSRTIIDGCVYGGTINGNAGTVGSIWGWSDEGATAVLTNCLDKSGEYRPIGIGGGEQELLNVYNLRHDIYPGREMPWPEDKQGVYGYTLTGEGITLNLEGTTGLVYKGVIYAGEGETVTLKAAKADGTAPDRLVLTDGETRLTADGENGIFILAMPAANLTVTEQQWVPELTITGGTGYTYANAVLTITDNGEYTISMAEGNRSSGDTIVIEAAATVTLDGVTIGTNKTALTAAAGSTIRLKGVNSLTSGLGCRGIETDGNGTTITSAAGDGSTEGELTVTGGVNADALGDHITIRGGRVTAKGTSAIGEGLTVTGGEAALEGTGSSAIGNGQVQLDYPQGTDVCVFSFDSDGRCGSAQGSPFTGSRTVTGLDGKSLLIKAWEAPVITLTEEAQSHLTQILRSYAYGDDGETVYARGEGDLNEALAGLKDDTLYSFRFDYPVTGEEGGNPSPYFENFFNRAGDYAYFYRFYPCSRLAFDTRDDAFTLTYIDTDGTVMRTETWYPGAYMNLYKPEAAPGQIFTGWLAEGAGMATGIYMGSFQEATTLRASWTTRDDWHSIQARGGARVLSGEDEETTWAFEGTQLFITMDEEQVPKGMYCARWSINGIPMNQYSFQMPAEDVTIEPVFAPVRYRSVNLTAQNAEVQLEQETDNLYYILENRYLLLGQGYDTANDARIEYYDLNRDWAADVAVILGGNKPVLRRESGADALNGRVTLEDYRSETGYVLWFAANFGEADFMLPRDIRSIGESAFEGLAMTAAEIPDGCESIGAYAFRNCRNLKQIRIPASVKTIDDSAFEGCSGVAVFGDGEEAERIAEVYGFEVMRE